MSHIVKLKTKITDPKCLIEALKRVGVREELIEYYSDPEYVKAYHNNESFHANVIVRRYGRILSDIGWRFTSEGAVSYIDDMYYDDNWQNKLQMYYNVEKCKAELKKRNIRFVEKVENDKITIQAQLDGGSRWQN